MVGPVNFHPKLSGSSAMTATRHLWVIHTTTFWNTTTCLFRRHGALPAGAPPRVSNFSKENGGCLLPQHLGGASRFPIENGSRRTPDWSSPFRLEEPGANAVRRFGPQALLWHPKSWAPSQVLPLHYPHQREVPEGLPGGWAWQFWDLGRPPDLSQIFGRVDQDQTPEYLVERTTICQIEWFLLLGSEAPKPDHPENRPPDLLLTKKLRKSRPRLYTW